MEGIDDNSERVFVVVELDGVSNCFAGGGAMGVDGTPEARKRPTSFWVLARLRMALVFCSVRWSITSAPPTKKMWLISWSWRKRNKAGIRIRRDSRWRTSEVCE